MRRVVEDAATALLRVLGTRFADFDGTFRIEQLSSRGWASVTFSGARHCIVFSLAGEGAGIAADAFLTEMGEIEFDLRGHILADIELAGDERDAAGDCVLLTLAALTVEDG